jgi:tetratricopeptide (TPR) repeat protein
MGRNPALRAALRAVILALFIASPIAAAGPDLLATARRLYNDGQYDQALETAKQAVAAAPATSSSSSSGRLIMGRARLERFRRAPVAQELDDAREDLRAVDPRALDPRERIELQIGLGELLYLEDRFGPAAELLEPVVEASATLAPDAHARALDWWATALDRQAQTLSGSDRAVVYARIIERMELELRRDPASTPATYWLAASARAAGDLDRAWSAALAGWVRAALGRDRGVALRADLDKLVTLAIIPDRAAKVPSRDRRQAAASLTAEWDAFKKIW